MNAGSAASIFLCLDGQTVGRVTRDERGRLMFVYSYDWREVDEVVSPGLQFFLSSHPIPRPRLSNCPDPQSLSALENRRRP
jgi:hypothetical protein